MIPEKALNRIYNMDCIEGMERMYKQFGSFVDLIVMDPPYQITQGKSGGAFGRDKRSYHGDIEVLTDGITDEVLDLTVKLMKNINIYIWCSKDQLRQYINYFENLGAKTDLLTWHKTNPVPTCNNKYLSDTEYLLFFRGKGVNVYGEYKTKKKYYVTPTNKQDKKLYGHPTIKPLGITENLIINSSQEGEIVFDPFMGSATTAVAARNLNRKYVGFELSKEYYDISNKRLQEVVE